ncbi:hypothetical protein C8Q73DRAFT_712010 [Cubamyces lactineus]|nr:hypothetical protein C8Q73DRAFT_712010 [Cubamyces lactineus]
MFASSLSEATIETYVEQVLIANYIHVSATVVLVYDTIITLDREVAQVWKGGSVWFAVLYGANRYCSIANRVMVILERIQWKGQTIQVCGIVSWLDTVLLVITWLAIATFSALRVYALSGKRLWLLLVVLCFGLVLPVADLYQQTTISPFILPSPLAGCNGTSNMSLNAYRLLASGARASSIVSDLIVLLVTLRQTYRIYRVSNRDNGPTLSRVLFENGSFYFVVLFLFNLCDIVFLQISVNGAIADFVTMLVVPPASASDLTGLIVRVD